MKVFLIGSTGYIGTALRSACGLRWNTLGTSAAGKADIAFSLNRPEAFPYGLVNAGDFVVVMAAISSPDACAKDYDNARQVNVTGTLALIRGVVDRGARVIFFSSDTVYGAREESVDEDVALTPVGAYGEMKRDVEMAAACDAVKVIRLSYVFSFGDRFSRYLFDCAQTGRKAEIFKPFSRCVVHLRDVVDGVVRLVEDWDAVSERVFNFVGPHLVPRETMVERIHALVLPALDYVISEPSTTFFDNRPRVINASSARFARLLGRGPSSLGDAIDLEMANMGA